MAQQRKVVLGEFAQVVLGKHWALVALCQVPGPQVSPDPGKGPVLDAGGNMLLPALQ